MKTASFSAKVVIWTGNLGWHFVYLPKDLAQKIKKIGKTYGGGFIKVEAKIGKTIWPTSLFPYKRESTYLVCIKKSVREKEDIFAGEDVKVSLRFT
jgi:hypothetical protein